MLNWPSLVAFSAVKSAKLLLALLPCVLAAAPDIVIYGGTPGGIAAAISAAKQDRSVLLVAYQDHLGGMMTAEDLHRRLDMGADIVMSATAAMWDPYLAQKFHQWK